MPLIKGSSKRVIGKNIKELVSSKPSRGRAKGIATLAKRRGIPFGKAKQIQAQAIAYSKAGKSRVKSKVKTKKIPTDTGYMVMKEEMHRMPGGKMMPDKEMGRMMGKAKKH